MRPETLRSPAAYPWSDIPTLVQNLDLIVSLVTDEHLPPASRFDLGAALYSLGTYELIVQGKRPQQLNEQQARILKAAITGQKVRYEIANAVNPPDGLTAVYYAAGLVSEKPDAALAKKVFAENGWNLDEKVIADAYAGMAAP